VSARLKGNWSHEAFFDYVDRWVAEAADGAVDKDTLEREAYNPFKSDCPRAMWEKYRPQADTSGARQRAAAGEDACTLLDTVTADS
jgi:hypothetical protein